MRTGVVRYGIELDTLSDILHHIVGKVHHKTKACGILPHIHEFNPLPNDKILDLSKFEGFADNKTSVTQKLKLALQRVDNIVEKEEIACYQHFLLFPKCFQNVTFSGSFKSVKSCEVKS